MSTELPSLRAAQYVRMSTEHQQYSTANQKQAIADYAKARGMEIVVTYEDLGKSGLTLAGRPSLCKLIADVVSGRRPFDVVLVYDVSRWGRFQDADESAHLEYVCRLAGVAVEYCAESFPNDGSPFSSICKVVKRALAAEYSRELSNKVYSGKRRLIELGFRQGGCPGFGLRRCLVDVSGVRKGLLARGERKSIATDRIILVPGPPEEIAIVQRIYRDYTSGGMGCRSIAAALNRDSIRSESGRRWSEAVVKRVLTSEKYIGDSVWGRRSFKLRAEHHHNDPSTWARYPGAFEAIVSRELFAKAQKVRARRARRISDDEIVRRLRRILEKHGQITTRLINEDGFLSSGAIRKRFGGLLRAYAHAGFHPKRDLACVSLDGAARRLRAATAQAVADGIRASGGSIERLHGPCRFIINGEIVAAISVAQQRRSPRGDPRWHIGRGYFEDDLMIAVLMDGRQERVRAYYFVPGADIGRGLVLAVSNPVHIDEFRSADLEPLFRLCARCDPAAQSLRSSGWNSRDAGPFRRAPGVRSLTLTFPRSRHVSRKSFAGAFLSTTRALREASVKADVIQACFRNLRSVLVKLLIDVRFVKVLALEGILTVPSIAFFPEEERHARIRSFQERILGRAVSFLADNGPGKQARQLLDKLTPERRIEAAETMVMTNDITLSHARALVAATPKAQILRRSNKHIYGASQRELRSMVEEGAYTYREAKRALACFGCDALGVVALAAFARRLVSNQRVVGWLQEHDRRAVAVVNKVLARRLDGKRLIASLPVRVHPRPSNPR